MTGTKNRRDGYADGLRRPRWSEAVAAAVVVALGVASVTYLSLRRAGAARGEMAAETDELLLVSEIEAKTHLTARLVREYLLTGRRELVPEIRANEERVHDLLRRAAARPDEAAETALREETRLEALRAEILFSGMSDPERVRRFDAEIVPLHAKLDDAMGKMLEGYSEAFREARAAFSAAARRALWALVASAVTTFSAGTVLLLLLRRSIDDLRASESRMRTIFEHAPVGIAHVGLDGRWLRVNARYRDILGYSEEALRRLRSRDVTHPDDVEKDARQAERLIAGEIVGYALEKRYLRKDGEQALVDFTASLVRDRAGNPWYFITAAEDIGDRKEIERQLREAIRARDELMQVTSHELRTPLTTLQLQVESLRSAVARGTGGEKAIARADAALRQVARVDALVDGLLDIARLDEASFALRLERSDLVGAMRHTLEQLRPLAAREGVEISLDAPGEILASFDRKRVDQALAALVSNAVKYGPGRPVDVRLETVAGMARISVRDRGIGVDATQRERIFGRFERAVSARHYGGLGLGLFITRRIAEAHGGTVRVEPAPEQGSTFVLELPLVRHDAENSMGSGAGI